MHREASVGVAGLLTTRVNTIGYLSLADAVHYSLDYALLENQHGVLVEPFAASVRAAMRSGVEKNTVEMRLPSGRDAYLLSGLSYVLARKRGPIRQASDNRSVPHHAKWLDCGVQAELFAFFHYIVHEDVLSSDAEELGVVPVDVDMYAEVRGPYYGRLLSFIFLTSVLIS